MSDMQKWIDLIEGCECQFKPGQSVSISKEHGGGVGQFVSYSPGKGTAEVNVKGNPQEFQLESLSDPIDSFEQRLEKDSAMRYDDQEQGIHQLPDRSELMAGDSVTLDGVYGSGMGKCYGVFVSHTDNGKNAIININGEDKTFSMEVVELAPEEDQTNDTFYTDQNDGSMSPMSLVADTNSVNITADNESDSEEDSDYESHDADSYDAETTGSGTDDFDKWMSVVDNSQTQDNDTDSNDDEDSKVKESINCSCQSYDCHVCFPLTESEKTNIAQSVIAKRNSFDEVILVSEDSSEWDQIQSGENTYGVGKQDDEEEWEYRDRIGGSPDEELTELSELPDNDTGEKIGKILYMQDMGMYSGSTYDEDKLHMMKPQMIDRIYAKVVGAGVEEDATMQGSHEGRQHGPIDGLEGPFRAKNGMVYYYDPVEGAAYDPDTDHYLSDEQYIAMTEDDMRLSDLEETASGGASCAGGVAMGGKQYEEEVDESKADKDYDKDGKIESEKDEHYGSVGNAIDSELDEADQMQSWMNAIEEAEDDELEEAIPGNMRDAQAQRYHSDFDHHDGYGHGEEGMDAFDMGDMVSYDDDEFGAEVNHDHNDIELVVGPNGMRDISHDDGDEPGRYASNKGHRIPGRLAQSRPGYESAVKSVPGTGLNESTQSNLNEADADVVRAMKALFE